MVAGSALVDSVVAGSVVASVVDASVVLVVDASVVVVVDPVVDVVDPVVEDPDPVVEDPDPVVDDESASILLNDRWAQPAMAARPTAAIDRRAHRRDQVEGSDSVAGRSVAELRVHTRNTRLARRLCISSSASDCAAFDNCDTPGNLKLTTPLRQQGRSHRSLRTARQSTVERVSLTVTTEGVVSIIQMDDGKANALSPSLMAEVTAALDEAEANPDICAAVLAGRDGRFSAGFDLNIMRSGDFAAIVNLVADGGALVRRIYGGGIPVVAACTGHALAGGALLLLGCDVRVGADIDAKVGLNEVAIGMVLPGWAMTLAEARLSRRHGQRAIVNARVTAPSAAVDVGFLDEVVPADDLMERAVAEAAAMATLEPAAYLASVNAYRGATLALMDEQITADRAAVRAS